MGAVGEAIGVARVGRLTWAFKARRNGPCGLACGVPASKLWDMRERRRERGGGGSRDKAGRGWSAAGLMKGSVDGLLVGFFPTCASTSLRRASNYRPRGP